MVSQFFYLPADSKKDEEERISFTQARIKSVKDWFQEKIIGKFNENSYTPKIFIDRLKDQVPKPVVSTRMLVDNDCRVFRQYNIKASYYSKVIEEFCAVNKCKIAKTDFDYILMLTFRDNSISASFTLGTLNISEKDFR